MPLGLPQSVKDNIEKCRAAGLAAVDVYNRPGPRFRTAHYIILVVLAWTALFHALFYRKGIKPWYKKKGKNPKGDRYLHIEGEPRHWELGECLKQHFGGNNPPERKNLEFLIGLRNKIEHRMLPELDAGLYGECQAALLNLEDLITSQFGARYGLAEQLAVSLQFTSLVPAEKKKAARALAAGATKTANNPLSDADPLGLYGYGFPTDGSGLWGLDCGGIFCDFFQFYPIFQAGGGGGGGHPPPKSKPKSANSCAGPNPPVPCQNAGSNRVPNLITCNTVLPDGSTVGSHINSVVNSVGNSANTQNPVLEAQTGLNPISVMSQVYSGINFRAMYGGPSANYAFLGDAGNFAYGAVSAQIGVPLQTTEAVAGGYSLLAHPSSDWVGPYYMDPSATVQVPAGYYALCNE